MDTYNVKQIADMLNTQPETVRRWIRSGKLHAEKASRKDGHVVTEGDLNNFLKSSPKYASMAGGLLGAAMIMPIAAVPVVGVLQLLIWQQPKRQRRLVMSLSQKRMLLDIFRKKLRDVISLSTRN